MLTFKHLRYFEALARLRHFGRAAEACAVTQPALSMQIQDLELRLGVALLERRRGEVRLTAVGEEIARRAQAILMDIKDLTDFARHGSRAMTGELVLGAIPSVAPYLLPAALPLIRARFPELELVLRETVTATLMSELAGGQVDIALLALPVEDPDTVSIPLIEDPFVLAAPAAGALAPEQPVTPDSIPAERMLLLEEGHCFRDQALAVCGRDGSRRAQFGATSLATLVQLVANGYGLTLLPEMAVPVEVGDDPRIRIHRLAAPTPSRTIGLAFRRTSPRAAAFSILGEVLRTAAEQAGMAAGLRTAPAARQVAA